MTRHPATGVPLRIVGLMSGTSADGIDAALVSIEGTGRDIECTLERFLSVPYPPQVRRKVLALAHGRGVAANVATMHQELGELFGEAAAAVLDGVPADLVGSHGQTVAHITNAAGNATLQLGSPAAIAVRTGVTVASDFRSADIAAGGQGAPLVSFVDWLLLRHAAKHRVALNIGGIANITYLPPRPIEAHPVAFDTGPGNAPIDHAVTILTDGRLSYDRDGLMAAQGRVDDDFLRVLLQHPFLNRPPPKTTGLEEFGQRFVEGVIAEGRARSLGDEDVVATLTKLTALSIAIGVRQLPGVDEIVVAGGGSWNKTLMSWLRSEIAPVAVLPSDAVGMPVDAKEAMAFAVLANQTVRGLSGNLPSCTGASRPVVLGSITPGENFSNLMRKLWK